MSHDLGTVTTFMIFMVRIRVWIRERVRIKIGL